MAAARQSPRGRLPTLRSALGSHLTSWYSRRGTDNVGTLVSGSLQLTEELAIDRVGYAAPSFRMNREGSSGSLEEWAATLPAGAVVTVETPHGTLSLPIAGATVGAGFIRWALNNDQQSHAATVTSHDDELVEVTIR